MAKHNLITRPFHPTTRQYLLKSNTSSVSYQASHPDQHAGENMAGDTSVEQAARFGLLVHSDVLRVDAASARQGHAEIT